MDTISPERRSENMRRIRSKDTNPELRVRRLTHGMGYRYRLHSSKLPGRPDLTFQSRRKVIFVNGCFWHQHGKSCKISRLPKSRLDYWVPKLRGVKQRDSLNQAKLTQLGWDSLVVWECQLGNAERLAGRINSFLDG